MAGRSTPRKIDLGPSRAGSLTTTTVRDAPGNNKTECNNKNKCTPISVENGKFSWGHFGGAIWRERVVGKCMMLGGVGTWEAGKAAPGKHPGGNTNGGWDLMVLFCLPARFPAVPGRCGEALSIRTDK